MWLRYLHEGSAERVPILAFGQHASVEDVVAPDLDWSKLRSYPYCKRWGLESTLDRRLRFLNQGAREHDTSHGTGAGAAVGRGGESRAGDDRVPEGFQKLFNGKDLTGWKATGKMDIWGAEKGVLYVAGGGGGWLMTEKEYANFELHLEFKMPKMGNSGVGLRSPLKGDPAYVGMEIQLIDDANWKGLKPTQHTGSIYGVVPAAKVVTKPFGEWNIMRIIAKGRQITIYSNGAKLVDANLDDYKNHFQAHPGLTRTTGHIGLQSYNFRVEFRNIYIKRLD